MAGNTAAPFAKSDFAIRLAIFYGAIFLIVGSYIPYFPVWLDGRGLSKTEIAIILATPLLVRIFFTPAIAFLADHFGDQRATLIILCWSTLGALLILSTCYGFWYIFAVSILLAAAWTTIMPLTETVAMRGVKKEGLDYGRMRLWGSLTFIAISFFGGYAIDGFGAGAALWLMIGSAVFLVLTSYLLPKKSKDAPVSPPPPSDAADFITSLSETRLSPAADEPAKVSLADARALIASPLFLLFLMTASAVQATHAVYYGFGTLHWQSLGIPTGTIGALWATGVFAEIVLFAYSGAAIARFGVTRLLFWGAIAALLRWTVTAQDPSLWLLFPLQILHALSFGATHLAAVHFITQAVPERYTGTAQGVYASFSMGIIMGVFTIIAGPLYEILGGFSYLIMGVVGGLAAIGAWVLQQKWDGGQLKL